MTQCSFDVPADFFASGVRRRVNGYRRFATMAEAIKFAVESQDANGLRYSILESDEDRLEAQQISDLYDSEAFPLPRTKSGIERRPS